MVLRREQVYGWGHPIWTGDRHYGTACPHREGSGISSHPAQTLQGEAAESCSPLRPVCLSTYFSHLSSSPLFPAQFEAELLATEPSQCQQTTQHPMGQPWRWHLAVPWPWHREPGPQSGCLHGCAWPKINDRKSKETQTRFQSSINVSCQASPLCGSPLTPGWISNVQVSSAFLVHP